jgi:hypothetical protein
LGIIGGIRDYDARSRVTRHDPDKGHVLDTITMRLDGDASTDMVLSVSFRLDAPLKHEYIYETR